MNLKKLEPIYIENSKLPVFLSFFAPINIWALSFFIFVWCRGVLENQTKRHECIHFQQQLEMLFIFQWIMYAAFWLQGMIKYKGDGKKAYYRNPFEQEAYEHDEDENYLAARPRWNWRNYKV